MIDNKTGRAVLTEKEYQYAADLLECEREIIQSISEVECPGRGFQLQRDGTVAPVIVFEKHLFGRLTNYRYNKSHPDLSAAFWEPGTYGPSDTQHIRLANAKKLNEDAALMSCSWGKFQILGLNYSDLGYKDLQDFVKAMYNSEIQQMLCFLKFIESKPALHKAIQNKNFKEIARLYNGKGYAKNRYDEKIKLEYQKLRGVK